MGYCNRLQRNHLLVQAAQGCRSGKNRWMIFRKILHLGAFSLSRRSSQIGSDLYRIENQDCPARWAGNKLKLLEAVIPSRQSECLRGGRPDLAGELLAELEGADVGFRANTGRSVDPHWMSAHSHNRTFRSGLRYMDATAVSALPSIGVRSN